MPRFLTQLSIGTVLGLVIGSLSCLLVALCVGTLVNAVERSADANRITGFATASQQLFNTMVETRIERGRQLSAFLTTAPADDIVKSRIDGHRTRSEASYQASIGTLAELDWPALAPVMNALRSSHDAVSRLRPMTDAAVRLPKTARDVVVEQEWRIAVQSYIDALIGAGDVLDGSPALAAPLVNQLLLVKRSAWTARNYWGLISLRSETAVAEGKAWNQTEIMSVSQDQGRAANAWSIVAEAGRRANTPRQVVDAITAANLTLVGPLAREQQRVIDALRADRVPSIGVVELQNINTELLDDVVQVSNVTMNELVALAQGQKTEARNLVLVNGLMLLAALALAGAGFVLVYRRVSDPIRKMTEVMRQLADRNVDVAVPGMERGDEIGHMAAAVQVFKEKMILSDRLAADLREAQAELLESAKLAFLGSMVAGIAHEVNTPVGICVTAMSTTDSILAGAERSLIARELTEDGLLVCFAKLRTTAQLVLTNLERAATLVRRFKGIATDQATEAPRRIELGAYLNEIVASLQPELKRSRIAVQVTCAEPVEAIVLPGALWQIVSNLVLNGLIHAFDPGAEGTISLIVFQPQSGWASLTYADDGKGMSPEIRSRIFEPFFTTRRGQGGTGLGLFITYKLAIQTLGGRIRCDSSPDRGTRFDITFPTTSPTSTAPAAEALPQKVLTT